MLECAGSSCQVGTATRPGVAAVIVSSFVPSERILSANTVRGNHMWGLVILSVKMSQAHREINGGLVHMAGAGATALARWIVDVGKR